MYKGVLGAMALLLTGAVVSRAEDKPAEKAEASGAIQVQVQGDPAGPIKILVNGKEVKAGAGGIVVIKEKTGKKVQDKNQLSGKAESKRYWLGLQIAVIDDEVRQERKLPKGEGVLVGDVLKDSPAAKAGLQPQDVLVKVGKKTIKEPADLIGAVRESQGKPLSIELLRDGKTQTVTVTPGPAPARFAEAPEPGHPVWPALPGAPGGPPTPPAWRWLGRADLSLPDDMTVTITKTGKKPAEVVVKQGDKKWEAREKDLGRLPEKARPYVERMLGQSSLAIPRVFVAPEGMPKLTMPRIPDRVMRLPVNPAVDKRLDEMGKRIDKLQSMVEELQKKQPQEKKK